jgi:hypothetical protein
MLKFVCVRERDGENETERQTERMRQRNRKTERQRDRQRQTETDRDRQRQTETDRDRQRQTDRHTESQTDRQTDRKTEKQTDINVPNYLVKEEGAEEGEPLKGVEAIEEERDLDDQDGVAEVLAQTPGDDLGDPGQTHHEEQLEYIQKS